MSVLTPTNISFILQGLWLTVYTSFIPIVLLALIGTMLTAMRNGKNPTFRWISGIYTESIHNVPDLLWIFITSLVFQVKSTPAEIIAFTALTSAVLAEVIRGESNGVDDEQTEAGLTQGMTNFQISIYITPPRAFRKILPTIISQFVTVIRDTSLLYSVIAIQKLFDKSQILMGRYFGADQVFMLYVLIAAIYSVINFTISTISRRLAKKWEKATEW